MVLFGPVELSGVKSEGRCLHRFAFAIFGIINLHLSTVAFCLVKCSVVPWSAVRYRAKADACIDLPSLLLASYLT